MSQFTRMILTATMVLAVLFGATAIERKGGQAAATTIRPDKEQVRRSVEVPGTMIDSCVAPAGHGARNTWPVVC